MVNEQPFEKAMGIAPIDDGFILSSMYQIHKLKNVLRAQERAEQVFDKCYVPRVSYTTGALDAHDVGVLENGTPIFVNTRFNCLATPSDERSFSEVWRPPFVTDLVDEDRCHLNGLAMKDGAPAFVTAASRSNTIDGWRDRRADGGVVIDVARNEVICDGLSMPHSPRLSGDVLWLLNSGEGELGFIDLATKEKTYQPHVFCPGFTRGLALQAGYAVVGLSKPRYDRFAGLGLDRRLTETDSEPWCGVQVIDLAKGSVDGWFRIDGNVGELYDVAILPNAVCPMLLSPGLPEIRTLIMH